MADQVEARTAALQSFESQPRIFLPHAVSYRSNQNCWYRNPSLPQTDSPTSENLDRRGVVSANPH